MKEIILHIGLHKTGSSSIQKVLKGYNQKGVKYINFEENNHSIPMYTIFSESYLDYHIWKNSTITKKQLEIKKQFYLKQLTEHIEDETIETLIISGEDISSLSAKDKKK